MALTYAAAWPAAALAGLVKTDMMRFSFHPGGFAPRNRPAGSLAGTRHPAPLARLTRYRSFALVVKEIASSVRADRRCVSLT